MFFICYICAKEFENIDQIIKHLKVIHMIKENVHEIKCVVKKNEKNKCEKKFFTFRSLKRHIGNCSGTFDENEDEICSENNSDQCENQDNDSNREVCLEDCNFNGFLVPRMNNLNIQTDSMATKLQYDRKTDSNIHEFLNDFIGEVISLGLNNKSTNSIFILCEKLVKSVQTFILRPRKSETDDELDAIVNYISNRLHSMNSQQKREKFFKESDNYIECEEKAVGVHWEMRRDLFSEKSLPTLVQSKFQFTSIAKQIIALCDQEDFRKMLIENNFTANNGTRKHICENDRYIGYCCGKIFKNNALFSNQPESLQIQLFIDGFELCDALKPRANVHTQVAVYFSILNLPHKFSYNQKNIHLVALCFANELKTKETDYNNLWDAIVKDISYIENNGIIIDGNITLKGKTQSIFVFQIEIK